MAEKGGNTGTRKVKSLSRSKGRKQEEEKQSKLIVEGEKGLKRVTFKGIEKSENMSLTEIIREVREETRKEIRKLKEDWEVKEKEREEKWKKE